MELRLRRRVVFVVNSCQLLTALTMLAAYLCIVFSPVLHSTDILKREAAYSLFTWGMLLFVIGFVVVFLLKALAEKIERRVS